MKPQESLLDALSRILLRLEHAEAEGSETEADKVRELRRVSASLAQHIHDRTPPGGTYLPTLLSVPKPE